MHDWVLELLNSILIQGLDLSSMSRMFIHKLAGVTCMQRLDFRRVISANTDL